ncbi:hypothetical protein IHQ68_07840 [Chelatococcus sambhunathii]|uniref:Uncharacterized protein n=1 Tax=Chelatococcus sambhunathii TaxID=363953 RepID=A0ABU1DEI2_9HYPH|nr:DUF6716 putative glycosyltransferase [Chelatococcus sambhunathii]MDR4306526.1 hypothetical protein [Chelatococcus sambhunathii]
MSQKRVLFACDLDSQVFGALPLARAFAKRGWKAVFALDPAKSLPAVVAEQLAGEFEVMSRPISSLPCEDDAYAFDAIGVYVTGSRISLFRHAIELAARIKPGRRPALFCGFNGLVFQKFEEGAAWRLGYDVICLNGPRDRDDFVDFVQGSEFAGQPYATVGLRRRPDLPMRPQRPPRTDGGRKTFVFAEQVIVPRSHRERRALVATLIGLAERSPDWDVVIKGRVRPDEQTFHQQSMHIERLVNEHLERPQNLILSYDPLGPWLEKADLFATLSSTALFDALDYGAPSLVVTDFGLRNADGAHVFFSSGLSARLHDLASLDEAPWREPDARWLDRVGYGPSSSPDELVDRLEAFDPSTPLPPSFVAFQAAAQVATDSVSRGPAIIEAWNAANALIPADGFRPGDDRSAAEAALTALGATIEAMLVRPGEPVNDTPLAAFMRARGMYWIYKRTRLKLGLPIR